MARKWELDGPDELTLTVRQVAERFGYKPKSWRALVRLGHVPPPRGFGAGQYYTGLDVAIIADMMGRWRPQEEGAENSLKVPESGRKVPENAEDDDSEDDD